MTNLVIKINEGRVYRMLTDNESQLFQNVLFKSKWFYSGMFRTEEELYNKGYNRLTFRKFLRDMYELTLYKPLAGTLDSKYETRVKSCAEYLMFLHKENLLDFDFSELDEFLDGYPKYLFYVLHVKSGLTYAFEIFLKELGYKVHTRDGRIPTKTQKEFKELKFYPYNGAAYFEPEYNDAFKEYKTIRL
jgi:hypothetical protein